MSDGADGRFPDGFRWGAATSAHQVEGGQENDWTEWERRGRVRDGSVSGAACEHWTRYPEDLDLARDLHLNAYRFSVEWSRIEPEPGRFDEAALAHYRGMVEACRQRGLEPFVTLWHFTNPRWFAARGGWEAPDAPERFAGYAERVARALPGVRFWMTVNEPNVFALLGYLAGEWPPEVRSFRRALRVFRQQAAAHRAAYAALHRVRADAQVGYATSVVALRPHRDRSPFDHLVHRFADAWYHLRWMRWVNRESDFIGVNHYTVWPLRLGTLRQPIALGDGGGPKSDFGWTVHPEGMYSVLRSVQRFGKPIYVTENGIADASDRLRGAYITAYLGQVLRAIRDGVDVRGYFHWSLLDNFEWKEGYAMRFGLVAVDFATQQRTVRPSARVYAEIARTGRLAPDGGIG